MSGSGGREPTLPGDPDPLEPEALTPAELQSRALRGATWTMINVVVSLPVAFAVNLLLARTLGTGGYGRLAFLTTLITLLGQVAALGLTAAMVQFGSAAHVAGRHEEVRAILSRSQGFRLLVVAPVLTIVVLLVIDTPWPVMLLAILFGIWVPAALDGALIALQIENRSATEAKYVLGVSLVTQVAVVAAVLWLATADTVWAARTVVAGAAVALTLLPVSRRYRSAVLRPRLPRGFPRGFWAFAIPTGLSGLVGTLALDRSELFVLQAWSSEHQVGLFALAFGLAVHLMAPAQVLTGPLLPAVAGLREVARERMGTALLRALRASGAVAALITAALLPPFVLLVPTLYGPGFADSAPMLLAMGSVTAVAVVTGPLSAFAMGRRAGRLLLGVNLGALAVDVLACLALIPTAGAWGAVIANCATVLVRGAALLVTEARACGLSLRVAAHAALPVLLGAAACVLGWWVASALALPVPVAVVVAGVIGAVLLLAAVRGTRSGLAAADGEAVLGMVPTRLQAYARPCIGLLVTPAREGSAA